MENFEKIRKQKKFDDEINKEKQTGKKKLNKKKKREERLEKIINEK